MICDIRHVLLIPQPIPLSDPANSPSLHVIMSKDVWVRHHEMPDNHVHFLVCKAIFPRAEESEEPVDFVGCLITTLSENTVWYFEGDLGVLQEEMAMCKQLVHRGSHDFEAAKGFTPPFVDVSGEDSELVNVLFF